ncbi:MAG: 4Fe-4S binding protein [Desulfobacteraceae bacterium]|nr:4Fe-4S binding protein [Desulfobacteraceae bacterium]
MKWSSEADQALKKVPFFVRKKVKKKVETYAGEKGKASVELTDVNELKEKFLSKGGMEKEVKGFEITTCFGGSGCPNSANPCAELAKDIETIFEKADILGFLKENVKTGLKFHHEFRVSLSDCPNACSRPQIGDIGIIGAVLPGLSEEECTLCNACVEVCDENAITLNEEDEKPDINFDQCLMCKKCINVCPSGTIIEKEKGYRVLLGGKLGRHPRLAMEIQHLHSHDQVLDIVKKCIKFYKKNSKNGQRFSHLLTSIDQIEI